MKCSIFLLFRSHIYFKDASFSSKLTSVFFKCLKRMLQPYPEQVWYKHTCGLREAPKPTAVTDKPLIINSQACRSEATLDLSFPTRAPNASWQFTDRKIKLKMHLEIDYLTRPDWLLLRKQRGCVFVLLRVHSPSHTIEMYWSAHPLLGPYEPLNILSEFSHQVVTCSKYEEQQTGKLI